MKKRLPLLLTIVILLSCFSLPVKAASRYSVSNTNNATGQDIVAEARKWANKGATYWSDSNPWEPSLYWRTGYTYNGQTSFDCSGFVGRILNDCGFRSPSYTPYGTCMLSQKYGTGYIGISIEELVNYGTDITSAVTRAKNGDYSGLQAGDIIGWTNSGRHVIIYAGLKNGTPWMVEFTGNGYYDRAITSEYQSKFQYGARFAESSGDNTISGIMQRLSSWKANLNGKYWNYYDRSVYDGQRSYVESQLKAIATSGALTKANATNAELGVTSSACGGSLYQNGCRSNYFGGGWQCYGFGWFIEYALFQSTYADNPSDWYVYSGNDLSNITLQPGDYVRFNNHTIIIADSTNDALNCVEAWGGSGCKISWSPGFNWSEYTTASGLLSAMKTGGGIVYRYKYIGETAYLGKCTPYKTQLTVEVTKATTLKTLPCSKGTDSESADVYTPAIGTEYTVTKLYKNTVGNYWYETSHNGTTCYVYAGDTEIVEFLSDTTVSGVSAPTALAVGDRFSIKGVVSSEKTELYQVGVSVEQGSETILQAYASPSSGSNSYSLLNSSIDMAITFNTLSAGTYTYEIYIGERYYHSDGSSLKSTTRWPGIYECTFTVGTPTIAAPQLKSYVPTDDFGWPYLGWGTISGAARYKVYRSDSKTGTYTLLGSTIGKYWIDDCTVPGNTYWYKVTAVTSAGIESEFSNTIGCTCLCANITSPSSTTNSTTGKPVITWSSVYGAASYEITRSDSSSPLGSVTGTSFEDTTAVPGTAYTYFVWPVTSNGIKAEVAGGTTITCLCPSNGHSYVDGTCTVCKIKQPFAITGQPTDKTVTEGGTAKFSVTATGDGLAYEWHYRVSSSGTWYKATGSKTATLSVPATMSRSGYQYRCKVTDSSGEVKYSDIVTLTVKSAFAITGQPAGKTITEGGTAKFSVTATGDGLAYEWHYRVSSSGTWYKATATGNKTATLSVPATMSRSGYQYRCKVTDSSGEVKYSDIVTLTVKSTFAITGQPAGKTITEGGTAKFSVTATGTGLTYQWQFKAPGYSWKDSPATGNQTATLSIPATLSRNGYQYRCIVTDGSGAVKGTNIVTLTVKPALAITSQPIDKSLTEGGTAKFSVTASGSGLTYQWQYRTSSTGSWYKTTATGSKTATLSVPATMSRSGYQYRCKVTDSSGEVKYTNTVTLTVKSAFAITGQPAGKTVTEGGTAKFSVTASGSGLSYEWQYRTSSSGSWYKATATGSKTATLSVPATMSRSGYQYRCKVTDSSGEVKYTNTVTLTVKPALAITSQPIDKSLTEGGTAKFSVTASGSGLTYQWQYRTSSTGSWYKTTATGSKTATLSVPATMSRSGYQYRCVVTDQYGTSATSAAATLTVEEEKVCAEITGQPENAEACVGDTVKFYVEAIGDGITYQWQYKAPGYSWKSSPATGSTTDTLTVPATAGRSGYQYRCVVTDQYGTKATSAAATLTVG